MRAALVFVVLAATSGAARAESKPQLTLGRPTVVGALDARAVIAVLANANTKLLACYKFALNKQPDLKGAATVTFTVGAEGKVTASLATGLGDDVAPCLGSTVGKLVFARPRDGQPAKVSSVLSFRLADDFGTLSGIDPPGGGFSVGQGPSTGGGIGTLGRSGSGYGIGPRRSSPGPTVSLGAPGAQGDLDRAIIRRYIKRNLMKIQYCYEKQLLANPALSGAIIVSFTIGIDGLVQSATAAGVSTEVSTCVAAVIKSIEFPKPRTSNPVVVRYPMMFRPS